MVALVEPDIEECYLLAILDSPDGIDLAEFAVHDPRNDDGCYRLYDFQWPWFAATDVYQIDMGGRNCGKTESIKLRSIAFPFVHPGKSMLLTAPELNHLRPLTDEVEKMLLNTRIVRELMPKEKSAGIARQPHWQVRFRNGASLVSRLPNKDGKGVKGQHVVNLEMDECFPAGTLITTKRGQIPIEDVIVGDEVVTHKNRYQYVTACMTRDREVLRLRGQGHPGLVCSTNHKFWAMETDDRALVPAGDCRLAAARRILRRPRFIPACDLDGAFWGSPTTWPKSRTSGIPSLAGQGKRPTSASTVVDVRDPDWFWIVGLYLAEGSIWRKDEDDTNLRIHLSVHEDEADEILARLDKVGLTAGVYPVAGKGVNVTLYHTRKQDLRLLAAWLENNFRRYSHGMSIPTWALGMPEEHRRQLLDGLIYGDGCTIKDERYTTKREKLTTVSKALAVSSRLLGLSLGLSVSIHWCDTSNRVVVIREREFTADGFYQVVFAEGGQGYLWENQRFTGIREVTPLGRTETLYDLSVEEDHSFIADGIIVSNSQDYPQAGWREVVETLNAGDPDACWRCHGVSRGVRDSFFEKTQPGSGWKVHRPMAMNRPSWSKEERDAKIVEYGGSRQSVDYRRNIYGEHGDASNSVFVLAKLMACVDLDEGSVYNQDVYSCTKIQFERFPRGSSDSERMAMLHGWIEIPGEHFHGYSQRVDKNREVGAPRGYSAYWGGMDVGVTNHPSEILIFGQRSGTEELELLTRVQMHRVNTDDQMVVVERLFEIYGGKLRLGIDRTGVGFPLWDQLTRRPSFGERIFGFGFSEKRLAAIEDRPLQTGETIKDLAIMRNVVETATDLLRNDYVDTKRLRLPYDREVLIEFQGQSYNVVRDNGDPYGVRRQYTGGSFHCVDESTEIMTSGGWRRYDQVEVGDDVLTMDVTTGCSRWSPIEALNIQSGPPIMIRSKSNAHDSLTTGSHRWPVRLYDGRTGTFGPLKWKTTATLSGGDGVPVAVPYGGAPAEAVYSDAFVELMAWYWTEGNCTKSNTVISQSSISEDNVERIRKALTEEFGPAGYMPEGFWHEYWSGTTCYFMLSMRVGCLLRSLAPDCNVRPEFLLALTAGQLDLFIRTSERGDGNHHPNSTRRAFQHQRDRQKTDALEMACALAGIATSTGVYERPTSRSGVSITVALLDKRFVRPANFRVEEPYSGDVWCPTTRDGTWLARRSGTVYWTGNSLDAAKVAVATKHIPPLEALLETRPVRGAVFDVFMGA